MENKELQQAKDTIAKKYGYENYNMAIYGSSREKPMADMSKYVNEVAIEYHRLMSECNGEIKEDSILIAKDKCKMSDGSGEALVIGNEYYINFIEDKDEEFAVKSNVYANHYFSTNKKHDSYWKRFFDLKLPQTPK